jgi:RNA polymerase sigma factor (sigma-70 family)
MLESEWRVSDGREAEFREFYGGAYDRLARLGFLLTGSRREPPPAAASAQADQSELLAVRAALAALPIKERTAVVLRFYADLPEREIAATMGVPAGSVKSLLHRGLRRLKGVLS